MQADDTTNGATSQASAAGQISPIHYEIRLQGHLHARWTAWFDGLVVTRESDGTTVMRGPVVDQAALHGLLRKLADQCGLTAALEAALARAGTFPQLSRGVVVVSMAVAIALGATSMSDIAVLAHLAPVLGDAPSGPTIRRALDLAGPPAMLDRIARARAKARAHVWTLIGGTPAGFPWLAIAGKTLAGWLVIDIMQISA